MEKDTKKMIKELKTMLKKRKEFVPIERINPNVEHYKPFRNKKRLGLVFVVVVGCLITPCTNWLLIPMFKLLNKYPLFLYK